MSVRNSKSYQRYCLLLYQKLRGDPNMDLQDLIGQLIGVKKTTKRRKNATARRKLRRKVTRKVAKRRRKGVAQTPRGRARKRK